MREIDNNINKNVNFKGIQKPAMEDAVPEDKTAPVEKEQTKEIKDLSKMPAAFLGKSQIAKDSLEKDMEMLLENPEKVTSLNNIFDAYAQKYGAEEAIKMLDEITSK